MRFICIGLSLFLVSLVSGFETGDVVFRINNGDKEIGIVFDPLDANGRAGVVWDGGGQNFVDLDKLSLLDPVVFPPLGTILSALQPANSTNWQEGTLVTINHDQHLGQILWEDGTTTWRSREWFERSVFQTGQQVNPNLDVVILEESQHDALANPLNSIEASSGQTAISAGNLDFNVDNIAEDVDDLEGIGISGLAELLSNRSVNIALYSAITGRDYNGLPGEGLDDEKIHNATPGNNLISALQGLAGGSSSLDVEPVEESEINDVENDIENIAPFSGAFDSSLGVLPSIGSMSLPAVDNIDPVEIGQIEDDLEVVFQDANDKTLTFLEGLDWIIDEHLQAMITALGLDVEEFNDVIAELDDQNNDLDWEINMPMGGQTIQFGPEQSAQVASLLPLFTAGMTLLLCYLMITRTMKFILPSD